MDRALFLPATAAHRRRLVLTWLVDLLLLWRRRRHERAQLARMGAIAWRDLGLSDLDLRREVEKPVWRA